MEKVQAPVKQTKPLHLKYRPTTFDQMTGQQAAVRAYKSALKDSRAFLFTGPAGTGKTTLARLGAKTLGIDENNINEVDAATNSGIDAMRELQTIVKYKPMDGGRTAIIVDECHGLSKQAWDSLLKSVEEPPEHLVWFFCTTNVAKVPATIKTRCAPVPLGPISNQDLADLVDEIAEIEKIDLPDGVASLIVREARGSARQALVFLASCRNVKNREAAAQIMRTALESDPVIELCRALQQGTSWSKAVALVAACEGQSPEGIRRVVLAYFTSVLKGTKSDKAAVNGLAILSAFERPFDDAEGLAPLYLAIGRVLLN